MSPKILEMPTSKMDSARPEPDGRARRTLRSRLKIIEAVFDLYSQGILIPTAQEVANRSGLGIRTVFRHFSEMETMYIAGNELLIQRYSKLKPILPDGDLSQRIEQLVAVRARLFEKFAPFMRATLVQKWRYKQAATQYQDLCERLQKEVYFFLPELKKKTASTAEMVNLIMSFEVWDRQRTIDGRTRKAIRKTMLESLNSLMKD